MSSLSQSDVKAISVRARKISGGIKPPSHKQMSLRSRIMPMPLPPSLSLPLAQYGNSTASPLVKVGDQVRKYELIAQAGAGGSVPLHAPTSGTVSAIASMPIAGPPGTSAMCIQIECDGLNSAVALQPCNDYTSLAPHIILQKITEAGICGMGGAGFPTAEKIEFSNRRTTELLIINGAECEPYISTDEALMRERAAAVIDGIDILRIASQAARCVIAIEKDKTDAITAMRAAIANRPVEILQLDIAYPTGGEKQIVQAVTGLEVPVGKHPPNLGILVHNVGTAHAVYQAVVEGKACISRITTLTGGALQTPKNFEALIGTPVSFLLNLCGIDKQSHQTTILGGSLMGIELARVDVPITKTSNCLIAATAEEFPAPGPELACIRCGFCADVCPAQLLPQLLYSHARVHNHSQLETLGLADCIECGACAYVCPSRIPLVQYYVAAKQELHECESRQEQSQHWQSRFQYHQYRLKQDRDAALTRRPRVTKANTDALTSVTGPGFSREQARKEIADAVNRARTRKSAIRLAESSPASTPEDKDK